jgi:hypothetical protein
MHGGGLVYRAGMIHVPDSRSGEQKIRVFPLDSLQFVPKSMRSHYHNYAYILVQKREYSVPVTPSFLSMDWDRNQYLTGKFKECTGKHSSNSNCRNHQSAQLCWIDAEREVADSPACGPFFCNMQGAASAKNPESKKDVLWIACSYGRARSSLLHVVELNRDHKTMEGIKLVGHRQLKFPPGLEDLHVSKTSDNLWLLTEFGPHEGIGNNRVVFAIKRSSFLPDSN